MIGDGHTYWDVVALRARVLRKVGDESWTQTVMLLKCRHCGTIREQRVSGDWSDYATGIYENHEAKA